MNRTILIDRKNNNVSDTDGVIPDHWDTNDNSILLVDLENEDKDTERDYLTQYFDLNPLSIGDAQRDRHPPKIEWFDNYYFLLLKAFDAETDSIDFGILHISFFVGKNFIITRHPETSPSIDKVHDALLDNKIDISKGPQHICYCIVKAIFDRYTPIILNLEKRLDQMEELMLENPNDELLSELMTYSSKLKKLKRLFSHQSSILEEISAQKFITNYDNCKHEYSHLNEQIQRLASLSNLLYELARDLIDGYISITAHRLNNIMKVLTIVAAIFMPLTFLAGVYGMNFENMPELNMKYAYFIMLGFMFVTAGSLVLLFKKLKWL